MGLNYHDIESEKYMEQTISYLSYTLFCLTISMFFFVNVTTISNRFQSHCNENNNVGCVLDQLEVAREGGARRESFHNPFNVRNLNTYPHVNSTFINFSDDTGDENDNCTFDTMRNLRIQNPKKVIMGHLNINSITNKFQGIMDLVGKHLDIFLISETKIDGSFPEAQFCYDGYAVPHRKDRALGGGGLMLFVNENIPSKKLTAHILPNDVEILCTEINLKKQKWVIIGIYNPPNMNDKYFMDQLSKTIDFYNTRYDRVVLMGDFNLEPSTVFVETLCHSHDLHNLVKEDTCFKGQPRCYDLILTNCKYNFQNTMALTTGFSDFHRMTVTILKTEYVKADPIQIIYRNFKKFNSIHFQEELRNRLYDDNRSNNNFDKFHNTLCGVLNKHAPLKKSI